MKKWVIYFVFLFGLGFFFGGEVRAVDEVISTSSAVVIDQVQDLTVPKVRVDRMTSLLNSQRVESILPFNFLKVAVRQAVEWGVSVNTVVLLFLFPLVASLVAFSRQVVGLNGFGMITPSLLAIAFLSTGGLVGIAMLTFVVGVAILSKSAIKKVRIPYLPKLAILLWMVSVAVLGLMLFSGFGSLRSFLTIGIFPIILFMSVAETFIEAQITRSFNSSLIMLLETVVLAFVSYKMMSSQLIQSVALLNPEIWLILVLAINLLIGRYKGLRLLEVWRFRKIITR